jgi:hypothetical protein
MPVAKAHGGNWGMAILVPPRRDHGQDARANHATRGDVVWISLCLGYGDLDDVVPF